MVLTLGNIKTSVGACSRLFAPLKPQVLENINVSGLRLAPCAAGDVFSLGKNSAAAINKSLKTLYNIDSTIQNPDLAKRTLSAVEDFVNVNKKNKMFSGLKIESAVLDDASLYAESQFDAAKKTFSIRFNENFDWKNLDKTSKAMYDHGMIPSDNPACLIYKNLGEFLNFRYNPDAYAISTGRYFTGNSALQALKVSNSVDISDFNANYIAGRMCGRTYPKTLHTSFEENLGNTDLRFPKAVAQSFKQGTVHKFKSIDDAKKYLSQNYAIEADFVNLEQVNLFAGSVDDLSKAIGSKEYFKGLKVIVDADKFETVLTKATLHWDYATGEAKLYINPAYNWKQHTKLSKSDYADGLHPTMNPKDAYTHELVHWLDFKGNPEKYGKIENAFSNGQTSFNDFGKSITAKVSGYAPYSRAEFNAEYICGRLNGEKYPAATNREFNRGWNGPAMTFENV